VASSRGPVPAEGWDPIEHVEQAGDDRRRQAVRTWLRQDDRYDCEDGEEREKGGQQTPCTPLKEVAERDSSGPRSLLEEEGRDEEAAQNEEDVNAQGSTGEQTVCGVEVEQHDHEYGHAAEAVQARAPSQEFWFHGCLILENETLGTGCRYVAGYELTR